MDELDQLEIIGFDQEKEGKKSHIEVILTEVFQDPTPLSEIKRGKFITNPMPDNVKKSRSQLIDEVISTNNTETGEISIENEEFSEIVKRPVTTRVSLSFDSAVDGVVSYSRALTNFDREVIDAVSTLASSSQIMTAATIYRMITGKDEQSPVNQGQKKRVEDSMQRCARCQITIDITAEYKAQAALSDHDDEGVWYIGNAINYEAIKHQVGRGTTIYYKINSMPPFYRFAEKLGKVSVFPLKLLDSPVSKTDNIIAVQSYLLRAIDSMKRDSSLSREIDWKLLYKMASQEGKQETAHENKRTRDNIMKILDFWIKENFIQAYESFPRKGKIKLFID